MYGRYRDRGFEVVAFPTNDFWQQEPGTNQAHGRTRQTYGPEQLQAELRADGFPTGIARLRHFPNSGPVKSRRREAATHGVHY